MSRKLGHITTEELEKELERRKQEKEEADKPKELFDKNWDELIKFCNLELDRVSESGQSIEKEYIYEEAMKAVFGEDVFNYINEKI